MPKRFVAILLLFTFVIQSTPGVVYAAQSIQIQPWNEQLSVDSEFNSDQLNNRDAWAQSFVELKNDLIAMSQTSPRSAARNDSSAEATDSSRVILSTDISLNIFFDRLFRSEKASEIVQIIADSFGVDLSDEGGRPNFEERNTINSYGIMVNGDDTYRTPGWLMEFMDNLEELLSSIDEASLSVETHDILEDWYGVRFDDGLTGEEIVTLSRNGTIIDEVMLSEDVFKYIDMLVSNMVGERDERREAGLGTIGQETLVQSYQDSSNPELENNAFTYDQAITGMLLLQDSAILEVIHLAGFYFLVLQEDFFVLEDFYGFRTVYNTQDVYATDGVVEQVRRMGDAAFIGLFALQFFQQTGNGQASGGANLGIIVALYVGRWIAGLPTDGNGGIAQGDFAPLSERFSTENNANAYRLLRFLGDSPLLPQADRDLFTQKADALEGWFINSAFDSDEGMFWRGPGDDTHALDANTFTLLSFGVQGLKDLGIDVDNLIANMESKFLVQFDGSFGGDVFSAMGFDYSDETNANLIGRGGIKWTEGTQQMIVVYMEMAEYYSQEEVFDAEKRDAYLAKANYFRGLMTNDQILDDDGNLVGYVHASQSDVRIWHDDDTNKTVDGHAVAPMAWAGFADESLGFNPFELGHEVDERGIQESIADAVLAASFMEAVNASASSNEIKDLINNVYGIDLNDGLSLVDFELLKSSGLIVQIDEFTMDPIVQLEAVIELMSLIDAKSNAAEIYELLSGFYSELDLVDGLGEVSEYQFLAELIANDVYGVADLVAFVDLLEGLALDGISNYRLYSQENAIKIYTVTPEGRFQRSDTYWITNSIRIEETSYDPVTFRLTERISYNSINGEETEYISYSYVDGFLDVVAHYTTKSSGTRTLTRESVYDPATHRLDLVRHYDPVRLIVVRISDYFYLDNGKTDYIDILERVDDVFDITFEIVTRNKYLYDANGILERIKKTKVVDGEHIREVNYLYDVDLRRIDMITSYDELGINATFISNYSYDANGRLEFIESSRRIGGQLVVTSISYYNLLTGKLDRSVHYDPETGLESSIYVYHYHPRRGFQTSVEIFKVVDGQLRLSSKTFYRDRGKRTDRIENYDLLTGDTISRTQYFYDDFGRLLSFEKRVLFEGNFVLENVYIYDPHLSRVLEWRRYDETGLNVIEKQEYFYVNDWQYDYINRYLLDEDAGALELANVTRYTYDGDVVEAVVYNVVIDGLEVLQYEYIYDTSTRKFDLMKIYNVETGELQNVRDYIYVDGEFDRILFYDVVDGEWVLKYESIFDPTSSTFDYRNYYAAGEIVRVDDYVYSGLRQLDRIDVYTVDPSEGAQTLSQVQDYTYRSSGSRQFVEVFNVTANGLARDELYYYNHDGRYYQRDSFNSRGYLDVQTMYDPQTCEIIDVISIPERLASMREWFSQNQDESPVGLLQSYPDDALASNEASLISQALGGMVLLDGESADDAKAIIDFYYSNLSGAPFDSKVSIADGSTVLTNGREQLKANLYMAMFAIHYSEKSGDTRGLEIAAAIALWASGLPKDNGAIALGGSVELADDFFVEENTIYSSLVDYLKDNALEVSDRSLFATESTNVSAWLESGAFDDSTGLFVRATGDGGSVNSMSANLAMLQSQSVSNIQNSFGADVNQVLGMIESTFMVQSDGSFGDELLSADGFDYSDQENTTQASRESLVWVGGTAQSLAMYQTAELHALTTDALNQGLALEYRSSINHFLGRLASSAVVSEGTLAYLNADQSGDQIWFDDVEAQTYSGASADATAWLYFSLAGFEFLNLNQYQS